MKFKSARDRIKKYVENPTIGIRKVENILDAAHSIRFQTERYEKKRLPHSEIRQEYIDAINSDDSGLYANIDINKIPITPDSDLLGFIIEHGHHLDEWQRDILEIVRYESQYFIPQVKTKILNEGWASFWHYKIMHELSLDSDIHLPFLKTHNQVIRPHIGAVNPYHLGFHIFKKVEEEEGIDECFFIREVHDDASALRCLIKQEDCEDLNLFTYSEKKSSVTVDDVSDEDGWKNVRNELIRNTGVNPIPHISVTDISDEGILILKHDHDGRDLELDYAERVVGQINTLWPAGVKLFTVIEEEVWEI